MKNNIIKLFISIVINLLGIHVVNAQPFAPQPHSSNRSNEYMTVYKMGLEAGLRASAEEIAIRKKILKAQQYEEESDSIIARTIISDKFFVKASSNKPTPKEIEIALFELRKTLTTNIEFKDDELKDLACMKASAKHRENQDEIRKLIQEFEQEKKRVTPDGIKNQTNWSIAEVQLVSYSNNCLVWNQNQGICQVTVSDFNKQALTFVFNRNISLDSARWLVLDKSINMRFYAQKAEDAGITKEAGFQKILEGKLRQYSGHEKPSVIDTTKLKKLYADFFDSKFSEKEMVEYKVIGSSDKKWMDSIYTALCIALADSTGKKNLGHRRKKNVNIFLNKLPWVKFTDEDLPALLANQTDTLGPGMFSRPISTPYGFFLVEVENVKVRPLISFVEAREQLYQMAQTGKVSSGKRSIPIKEAKAWYLANTKSFPKEDTLMGKLWLFPQSEKYKTIKFEDTASNASMKCSIFDLPRKMQSPIFLAARNRNANKILGPFQSIFGSYFFRIERIKISSETPNFEKVKSEILEMLALRPLSMIDIQIGERTEFIRQDLLAMAGFRAAIESVRLPTEAEVKLAEKTMHIELPPSAPPQMKTDLIKHNLQESFWRSELAEWKSRNLEINWNALKN